MKLNGMNPFEIRLHLLELATKILISDRESRKLQPGEFDIAGPTTEEIITEAEKLNSFVSRANSQ